MVISHALPSDHPTVVLWVVSSFPAVIGKMGFLFFKSFVFGVFCMITWEDLEKKKETLRVPAVAPWIKNLMAVAWVAVEVWV